MEVFYVKITCANTSSESVLEFLSLNSKLICTKIPSYFVNILYILSLRLEIAGCRPNDSRWNEDFYCHQQ